MKHITCVHGVVVWHVVITPFSFSKPIYELVFRNTESLAQVKILENLKRDQHQWRILYVKFRELREVRG